MKIHIVALAICPPCQSEVTEIADSGRVRPSPGIKVLTCILKSEFYLRDASILRCPRFVRTYSKFSWVRLRFCCW